MSFPRYPSYKDSGVEWLGEVPGHWDVKRLRFVAELNPSKSELNHLDPETLVSFLPMEAIGEDGSLSLERERPISELESGYTFFRNGDVTIAKITPCYENGKGALMQGLLNGVGFGTTELVVARPKPDAVSGPYLHYLFTSPDFRAIGESHMYGAGGQKRVPDAFVRNFATAFPPLAEQGQITAFLERETAKIDALVAEQQRLMDLLKEKRQAVISHAVTRGLDPDAPMKPSGIEWLGDVPVHWETLPLSQIASTKQSLFIDGDWIESKDLSDDGIRYLTSGNVGDGYYKEQGKGYISDETFSALNCVEVLPGDVLVSRLNLPIGRSCIVPDLGCRIVTCVDNVILRPDSSFDREFVSYQLTSKQHFSNMENLARGTTMQRISRSALGRVRFAFPPLVEQTQIAAYLRRETEKIDTLTSEAQRAIDLLQERRTALISAAVTGQIDVRGMTPSL